MASQSDAANLAAILRMPPMTTADPEWQDIVVLSGLVAMQQEVSDQQQQIDWRRPRGFCQAGAHLLGMSSRRQTIIGPAAVERLQSFQLAQAPGFLPGWCTPLGPELAAASDWHLTSAPHS